MSPAHCYGSSSQWLTCPAPRQITNIVSHDPLLREGEKAFEKLTHKKSFLSIFLEELKNEAKFGKKK